MVTVPDLGAPASGTGTTAVQVWTLIVAGCAVLATIIAECFRTPRRDQLTHFAGDCSIDLNQVGGTINLTEAVIGGKLSLSIGTMAGRMEAHHILVLEQNCALTLSLHDTLSQISLTHLHVNGAVTVEAAGSWTQQGDITLVRGEVRPGAIVALRTRRPDGAAESAYPAFRLQDVCTSPNRANS